MKPNYKSHPFSALTLALTLALTSPAALAEPVEFHITAQSLDTALRAFMEQSKAELLYSADLVRGLSANGLDGKFEPAEALQRLLTGSGLVVEQNPGGAYLLTRAPQNRVEAPQSLVVTATRTEQRITDVPAAVSVISREQIERQQAVQLSDLLRNSEGIDVNRSATLGGSETMTIRGVGGSFAGSTSPVLLDGMPLESPVAAIHVGLKALAPEEIERIEVVRGPASALYGPNAVGGVINVISRRWDGAPGAEVRFGAGSHDAHAVAVAAGAADERFDLRVSVGSYKTEGFRAQPEPDPWGGKDLEGRDGSERRVSVNGGIRPAANQEITFALRDTAIESAWLGGHPNYRLDNDVENLDLGYRYEVGNDATIKVNYRQLQQQATGRFDQDYYMGDGVLDLAEEVVQTDKSRQLDAQVDLRLADQHLLTFGYSNALGEYTLYDDVIIDGYTETRVAKSRLDGFYLQEEFHPLSALTIFASGRWDRYHLYGDSVDGVSSGKDSTETVFNPRLSLLWQVTDEIGLYSAAGTAYVPALNSLKYRNSARWLDNPDLDPERALSRELGVHLSAGRLVGRLDYFWVNYTDKISAITVDEATGQRQYQNLARTTVNGLELALSGNFDRWQPYVNYTYTESVIRDNPSDPSVEGNRMQWVSPNKLNLGVTYLPSQGSFMTWAGRYVDDYYTDDANSGSEMFPHIPDYFVADLQVGWELPLGTAQKVQITAAVNNLLDRDYQENRFEMADGRNYVLGLNAKF